MRDSRPAAIVATPGSVLADLRLATCYGVILQLSASL